MAGRTIDVEPAPLPPAPTPIVGASAFVRRGSARRLDVAARNGETALGSIPPAYQTAWENYDLVPEVQQIVASSAGVLAQCRLYVGFVDEQGMEQRLRGPDGELAPGFSESFVRDCEATLGRFVDVNGSQRGLLLTTAECFDVTGEAFMAGWAIDEDGSVAEDRLAAVGERWEVVPRQNLAVKSGRWEVQLDEQTVVRLPEDGVVYRMWRRHPRWPNRSRGWVLSVEEPCRDLLVFTVAQRAAGRSSSIADLLLVPAEASPRQLPTLPPLTPGAPTPAGATDGAGGVLGQDAAGWATFIERIIGDAVLEVMRDAQAGRTVIPPVVAMKDSLIEKVKAVSLARPVDEGLEALIEQARKRIADAADAAPEFLFGLGDTNRWNGAQIDDTDYRRYFRPKALTIADAWTMQLLWGGLRGLGYRREEYERVRVLVDPAGVVAPPDLGKAATEGLKSGAIGFAAWRTANGFSEDAAPSPEEQRLLLDTFGRTRQSSGSGGGGEPPTDVAPVNEDAGSVPKPASPTRTTLRAAAAPETGATTWDRQAAALLAVERTARARLEEAAEAALDVSLGRAGAKLRNWTRSAAKSAGWVDLLAQVASAETTAIPAVLGPERAAELASGQYRDGDERREDLFAAALLGLVGSFHRITGEAFAEAATILGVEIPAAEIAVGQAAGAAALSGGLVSFADRKVFGPDLGPSRGEVTGLRVPGPVIRRALAAAGGSPVGAGLDATVEATRGLVFGPTLATYEPAPIGWRWDYGPAARRSPWEPHRAVDGVLFSGQDDERLAGLAPGGGWGFPGDHGGCRCDWIPEAVPGAVTDSDRG